MKKLSTIILLLLSLILCLALASCKPEEPPKESESQTDTDAETDTVTPTAPKTLISDGKAQYVIMLPKNASASTKKDINALCSGLIDLLEIRISVKSGHV